MRRERSTVVALAGAVTEPLLAALDHSPNVAVVRAPAPPGMTAGQDDAALPAWETGAAALREAARRSSPYVLVAGDPLADVATAWRQMWDEPGGAEHPARFEAAAAEVLAAWRANQFELPDYYLLIVGDPSPEGTGPDLYLGPLRAARPHRVAADLSGGPAQPGHVLDTLRSLPHGPWWPPLDELIDSIRNFYAGGLTETQPGSA
jgi:hypothetical protein